MVIVVYNYAACHHFAVIGVKVELSAVFHFYHSGHHTALGIEAVGLAFDLRHTVVSANDCGLILGGVCAAVTEVIPAFLCIVRRSQVLPAVRLLSAASVIP